MTQSSLCVLVALLMVSSGMVFADEPTLIDPETTVVTVDDAKLSAGMILVPVGGEFKEWWQGHGHDEETQKRVRTQIKKFAEPTIDDQILRAMYDQVLGPV